MCYACKNAEDDRKLDRQVNANIKRRSTRNEEVHEDNEKSLRERLNKKYDDEDYDNDEDYKKLCRHMDRRSLQPFTMSKYFTKDYQDKMERDELPFPVSCGECGFQLKGA